jgi:hypothetical protein
VCCKNIGFIISADMQIGDIKLTADGTSALVDFPCDQVIINKIA